MTLSIWSSCTQGNASTKTRMEVRGGGKKPYAQKGTGNARRGSSVSPLFVGGGITFGPKVSLHIHFFLTFRTRVLGRFGLCMFVSARCRSKGSRL